MHSSSKSKLRTPSLAHSQRRAFARTTSVALALTLLAACGGTPEVFPRSDADSDSAKAAGESLATETPTADFDRNVPPAEALLPSGARSVVVARTRSFGGKLDDGARKALLQVGRIEHTFSDGRTIEFINSDAGNFGTGDIILGKTENLADFIEQADGDPGMVTRALVSDDDDDTWPNGRIQFVIDSALTSTERSAVNDAVSNWNADNPYVKWVPYSGDGDYVEFLRTVTTEFCGRSAVGRSFSLFGGQDLELSTTCFTRRTILHEMTHAAGQHHEQQRCGRNAFVTIHNSTKTGEGPRGTDYDELCGDSRNYGDYDYASIVHYRPNEFLDVVSSPAGTFMGLPSVAGTISRLSQDDVNGITWYHFKKTFSTTEGQGFAWASQPTGTFPAITNFAFNQASTAATRATITNLSTGRYQVDFPKLGKEVGGNVQVTAYGSDPGRCKVESWSTVNVDTLRAIVRCFNLSGFFANRLFTVSYQRQKSPSAGVQGGYLLSTRLAEQGAYTPDPYYQWNSTGQRNRVTHDATGHYIIDFPGLFIVGGTVRLTAHGISSDYCTIESWGFSSVNVGCFSNTGVPKDSAFSIAYTDSVFSGSYAFAWADQQANPRYEPSSVFQKAQIIGRSGTVPAKVVANRSGPGEYRMELPGVPPFSSNVMVAAYGPANNNSCIVVNWSPAPSVGPNLEDRRENVNVRCFNPSGVLTDSRFAITYQTNERAVP